MGTFVLHSYPLKTLAPPRCVRVGSIFPLAPPPHTLTNPPRGIPTAMKFAAYLLLCLPASTISFGGVGGGDYVDDAKDDWGCSGYSTAGECGGFCDWKDSSCRGPSCGEPEGDNHCSGELYYHLPPCAPTGGGVVPGSCQL